MELILMKDFQNPAFCNAFKQYFDELEISVKDWDSLFCEMAKDNVAYVLMENGKVSGFIQFKEDDYDNWFFKERIGFIREFWVEKNQRNQGYGKLLLEKTEAYFLSREIHRIMLTSAMDTQDFYVRQGYHRKEEIHALNDLPVFVKEI